MVFELDFTKMLGASANLENSEDSFRFYLEEEEERRVWLVTDLNCLYFMTIHIFVRLEVVHNVEK